VVYVSFIFICTCSLTNLQNLSATYLLHAQKKAYNDDVSCAIELKQNNDKPVHQRKPPSIASGWKGGNFLMPFRTNPDNQIAMHRIHWKNNPTIEITAELEKKKQIFK